jgi:glycosyltransferase involved in cell wall biosynthesis
MRGDEGRASGPEDDARRNTRPSPKERHAEAGVVTVVIPCYNQAHFLGEAVESVLSQSLPPPRDRGGRRRLHRRHRRSGLPLPGVRLIRQENGGLSAARNAGLGQSRGEYVVFLDADDRLLEEAWRWG